MKKNNSILSFILLLGLSILFKIPALFLPFTSHFASYQALNAMMASMIGEPSGIPGWIFPQTFMLQDGREGLHLLYYPFASLSAWLGSRFAGGGLDIWGRLQAVLYISLAGIFLWDWVRRKMGENTALLAFLVFIFSPLSLTYGVSFQNEAFAVFLLVLSFYLLDIFHLVPISGLVFGFCLVSRIHFLLILPAFLYALWNSSAGSERLKNIALFTFFFLIPVGVWVFLVAYGQNQWGHVESTLLDQAGEGRIFHSMLWSIEYCRRMAKILLIDFMNPLFFLFLTAALIKRKKVHPLFWIWLGGSFAAIFLFPKKIADHPFYLISGLPAAAVIAASLMESLQKARRGNFKIVLLSLCAIALSLRIIFPVLYPSMANVHLIPRIGKKIQALTAAHDRIIAAHGSSCDLLYYSGRRGWTFDLRMEERELEKQPRILKMQSKGYGKLIPWLESLRSEGAAYLVIADPEAFFSKKEFAAYVESRYLKTVLSKEAILFDLKSK